MFRSRRVRCKTPSLVFSNQGRKPMDESVLPKPKKSVASSGAAAGNTALCVVGRSGNDLHYRGYDILDVAEACAFEEIAHLLVHGTLPNAAEQEFNAST